MIMCRISNKPTQMSTSSLLKERVSFRNGIVSLVNIKGSVRFRNYMQGNDMDDMRRDWKAVGRDIRKSMKLYKVL